MGKGTRKFGALRPRKLIDEIFAKAQLSLCVLTPGLGEPRLVNLSQEVSLFIA